MALGDHVEIEPWGELGGETVRLITLRGAGGVTARICEYGAALVSLELPRDEGPPLDVVLGYDSLAGYVAGTRWLGAVAGRCANRIAGGRFELDGRTYELLRNDGAHHLHGGAGGFHRRIWRVLELDRAPGPAVALALRSPDGDQGYPGELAVQAVYSFTTCGDLVLELTARTSAPTLCNLAPHMYWNLGGHGSGSVADHVLTCPGVAWLPTDRNLIPTGELASVAGTALDFRGGRPLGLGHDRCLLLPPRRGGLQLAARLESPATGLALTILTDQPALQVYSAEHLDGSDLGKGGTRYGRGAGLCLETQFPPDAVHHLGEPGWPSPVLRPGELYRHRLRVSFQRCGGTAG